MVWREGVRFGVEGVEEGGGATRWDGFDEVLFEGSSGCEDLGCDGDVDVVLVCGVACD